MESGRNSLSCGPASSVRAASGRGVAPDIRIAGPDDLSALVDIRVRFLRAIKEIRGEDEPPLRSELAAMFGRGISSGKTMYWLARYGDEIAASCALLFPRGRGNRVAGSGRVWQARRAELMGVYTLPSFRRMGAASALLRHVIARARDLGLKELYLQPTDEARELYRKAGFADGGLSMSLALDAVRDPDPSAEPIQR